MKSNIKVFISSPNVALLQEFAKRVEIYKPNVLITYFEMNSPTQYTRKNRNIIGELMLDCGAFSLQQKYKNRPAMERDRAAQELFEGYKVYTKTAQNQYDHVISMDDRFDLESFEHNLERLHELEKVGVSAIPVIHSIYNDDEISYFIDNGYKMVAIGQCKGRDDLRILYPVVDRFYQAGVKVHLFGMTTPKLINHVPAYSCDSKSFLDYGVRGQVLFWNDEKKGLDKTDVIYFPKYEGEHQQSKGCYYQEYKYLDYFKRYFEQNLGIEFDDFLGTSADFYRELANMLYFAHLEFEINDSPLLP